MRKKLLSDDFLFLRKKKHTEVILSHSEFEQKNYSSEAGILLGMAAL
jgi:hypothetical protein